MFPKISALPPLFCYVSCCLFAVMSVLVSDDHSINAVSLMVQRPKPLRTLDVFIALAVIQCGERCGSFNCYVLLILDGKCMAKWSGAKFTEVSVVINHNVDELLVGILTQIRLKEELQREVAEGSGTLPADGGQPGSSSTWVRNKGLAKASMKAKQMFSWLFGAKDDDQFTNCENFQIL